MLFVLCHIHQAVCLQANQRFIIFIYQFFHHFVNCLQAFDLWSTACKRLICEAT